MRTRFLVGALLVMAHPVLAQAPADSAAPVAIAPNAATDPRIELTASRLTDSERVNADAALGRTERSRCRGVEESATSGAIAGLGLGILVAIGGGEKKGEGPGVIPIYAAAGATIGAAVSLICKATSR